MLLGHIIPNHTQQLCTRKDILPPPRVPVCPPSNMEHTLSTISTANLLNVEKSRCWVQRLASMSKLEKWVSEYRWDSRHTGCMILRGGLQGITRWHILHRVEVEWVWNKKFTMSRVDNFFNVYNPRSWNSPIETIINKLQDYRTFFHNLSFTFIIWCLLCKKIHLSEVNKSINKQRLSCAKLRRS